MKKRTLGIMALIGVAVLTASAPGVVIEKFEAEFTAFSGPDATAVSPVTSPTGSPVAGDFTVTYMDVGLVPAGWLTQGSIGGTPTTAKFTNPPGSGTRGRARFSAPLPTSMKGNDGVQVEWSARYGNYAMLRAPIQIAITHTGEPQGPGVLAFNAYLRVQNGTTLAIQSNSGSLYSTINTLTIPNVADGEYHQWTTQILVRDGMAYWDLWLDGTRLLFGGTDGSPVLGAGNTASGPAPTVSQAIRTSVSASCMAGPPTVGTSSLITSGSRTFPNRRPWCS